MVLSLPHGVQRALPVMGIVLLVLVVCAVALYVAWTEFSVNLKLIGAVDTSMHDMAQRLFTSSGRMEELINTPGNQPVTCVWYKDTSRAVYMLNNYHLRHMRAQLDTCYHHARIRRLTPFFILVDGEPSPLDDELVGTHVHAVITTKRQYVEGHPRTAVFLPAYLQQLPLADYSDNFVHHASLPGRVPSMTAWMARPHLCTFSYSNNLGQMFDGVVNRKRFYERMQELTGGRVVNLGAAVRNAGDTHAIVRLTDGFVASDPPTTNKEYFTWNVHASRNTKFVIAFENQEIMGYVSEKICYPLLGGAIPIYLGAPDVDRYINPACFIDVRSFPDMDACIEHVLRVSESPALAEAYLKAVPFVDNDMTRVAYTYATGGAWYDAVNRVLPPAIQDIPPPLRLKEHIRLAVFADGVKYRSDKIMAESAASKYFTSMVAYNRDKLPYEYVTNPSSAYLIHTFPRGFGLWSWKPAVVRKELKHLAYGDILVYLDSGCGVKAFMGERVLTKYHAVKQHDVLACKLKYPEREWTKRQVPDTLVHRGRDITLVKQAMATNQFAATWFILHKTPATVALVEEWYALAMWNNGMLLQPTANRQNETPSYREHRHDQSIWSMLLKTTPGLSVAVDMDIYTDDKLDTSVPFPAWRRRR